MIRALFPCDDVIGRRSHYAIVFLLKFYNRKEISMSRDLLATRTWKILCGYWIVAQFLKLAKKKTFTFHVTVGVVEQWLKLQQPSYFFNVVEASRVSWALNRSFPHIVCKEWYISVYRQLRCLLPRCVHSHFSSIICVCLPVPTPLSASTSCLYSYYNADLIVTVKIL